MPKVYESQVYQNPENHADRTVFEAETVTTGCEECVYNQGHSNYQRVTDCVVSGLMEDCLYPLGGRNCKFWSLRK